MDTRMSFAMELVQVTSLMLAVRINLVTAATMPMVVAMHSYDAGSRCPCT